MTGRRDDQDRAIANWIERRTPPGEPQFDVDQAWQRLRRTQQRPSVERARPRRLVLQIAAAAVATATLALGWQFARTVRGTVEVTAAIGQRVTVTLHDGSRVTLNGGSRIRYARHTAQGEPQTIALDGEALFEVRHDPRRAFHVNTGNVHVEDVGTHFAVRHYASDRQVDVAVREGAVRVRSGPSYGTIMELRAGEAVSVDSADRVTRTNATSYERLLAWTDGALVFDDTPLPIALADLERSYGVKISVADASLAAKHVSARFERQSADAALEALALAIGGRVERRGSAYLLTAGIRR